MTALDKDDTVLEAALAYAERGIPVFPCRNAPDSPKKHKRPMTKHGFKDATTDPEQIRRWWTQRPVPLIGMPTGSASGVDVLDLDVKDGRDGFAAVPDWEKRSPVIARTGSGGAHLYFRAAGTIGCTVDKIAPGVDSRGEGGYVVVPPSQGYRWVNGCDISALPPWPADLRPTQKGNNGHSDDGNHAHDKGDRAKMSEAVAAALAACTGMGLSHDDTDYFAPVDERAKIEAALAVIPADGYQTWFEVGAALRKELGNSGSELFESWSKTSAKYDAKECAAKWRDVAKVKRYGAGTIFHYADQADAGWRARFEQAAQPPPQPSNAPPPANKTAKPIARTANSGPVKSSVIVLSLLKILNAGETSGFLWLSKF